MSTVALVTGGSSGIGRETARALAAAGCTVYEFSRRASVQLGILHRTVDVTDEVAVTAAVAAIVAEAGGVDILVNNAGFGISGAVEFTADEAIRRQLDVNLFGAIHAVRAVLPYMRAAGHGRILNVSSVAAPVAIPFQTYYSVTKAGINAFTLALANEVRPFGISVCAVMPGDIRTGFTDAREKLPAGDEVYGGRIARSVGGMERDERSGMSPETAGRYIAKIAQRRRVKPLYAIGFAYKAIVLLTRLLPVRLVNWLVGRLYAA